MAQWVKDLALSLAKEILHVVGTAKKKKPHTHTHTNKQTKKKGDPFLESSFGFLGCKISQTGAILPGPGEEAEILRV